MKKISLLISTLFVSLGILAQSYQLAVLKYNGGGDYYANPTALPNLIKFCNAELGTSISKEVPYVEVGSADLFQYPLLHMTGHGNVVFSKSEALNLRSYLLSGGFLHIDDNYGMDGFIRAELKKVFPDAILTEVPSSHPIFSARYAFPNGLPKIHEHDNTNIFKHYKELEGELYSAEVHHVRHNAVILLDDNGNELRPNEKRLRKCSIKNGDSISFRNYGFVFHFV